MKSPSAPKRNAGQKNKPAKDSGKRRSRVVNKRTTGSTKKQRSQLARNDPPRPDPPPPPPASLVKLLRGDDKVLAYFQALQTNLDYDVRKWKTRAQTHKKNCQDVERQVQEWKQKHRDVLNELHSAQQASQRKDNQPCPREIEDNDFEMMESSSDSDTKPAASAPAPTHWTSTLYWNLLMNSNARVRATELILSEGSSHVSDS